jgi:DNA repair photolyase
MTTVADIQQAVQSLPEEEFAVFSSWFDQYEEERWDRQLERDQKSGPLRSLMEKARADFEAGKCSRL